MPWRGQARERRVSVLPLCFSVPQGESSWLDRVRSPQLSAQSPGLPQASRSRERIHFPSKDAKRDGRIELGVPGIQIREQRQFL